MARASEKSSAPLKARDTSAGLCVLVVEDDEADAYLIGRALARQAVVGLVVHAQDGEAALRMVEQGEVTPDLAFIDLHMPRKDGLTLLTAFAGRARHGFPMVVLTSSTAPADAQRSRLCGAMHVVTKPDSVEGMNAAVASAIAAVCPLGRHDPIDGPDPPAATARLIEESPGLGASALDG
jgi:CheY-like chemotaxis protein